MSGKSPCRESSARGKMERIKLGRELAACLDLLYQIINDISDFYHLLFTAATIFVLDFFSVEITIANNDGMWNTDQLHIGEHNSRPFFAVVQQDFDALVAQGGVQVFRRVFHPVGFMHIHRQNGDMERRDGQRPKYPAIIMVLFDGSSHHAGYADTVTTHGERKVTAVFT